MSMTFCDVAYMAVTNFTKGRTFAKYIEESRDVVYNREDTRNPREVLKIIDTNSFNKIKHLIHVLFVLHTFNFVHFKL